MRPRLLDLFCGAGGAAMGYHRAGFDVVGVDLAEQPRYPFEFHRADALTFPLEGFNAIHASPPCQAYSRNLKHLAAPQPMLIDPVWEMLAAAGVPWAIENVEGSPLPAQDTLDGRFGVVLCGTSFGLRVWRHRWFETTFPVAPLPCRHARPPMNPHNVAGRARMYDEHGRGDPEKVWAREMGVEWMNRHEAREAIPPAYTEHIGSYLMAELEAKAA